MRLAGQLAFTYLPFMHELFDARPIQLTDGLLTIAVGAALMIVSEVEKALMRRNRHDPGSLTAEAPA